MILVPGPGAYNCFSEFGDVPVEKHHQSRLYTDLDKTNISAQPKNGINNNQINDDGKVQTTEPRW